MIPLKTTVRPSTGSTIGWAARGAAPRGGAGVGEIDDLQPPVAERHRPGLPAAGPVRAAPGQRVAHRGHRGDVGDPPVEADLTGDPAHRALPSAVASGGRAPLCPGSVANR